MLKEKSDSSHEIVEIFVFGENIYDRLNDVPTYTVENEEVTLHNQMLNERNNSSARSNSPKDSPEDFRLTKSGDDS